MSKPASARFRPVVGDCFALIGEWDEERQVFTALKIARGTRAALQDTYFDILELLCDGEAWNFGDLKVIVCGSIQKYIVNNIEFYKKGIIQKKIVRFEAVPIERLTDPKTGMMFRKQVKK